MATYLFSTITADQAAAIGAGDTLTIDQGTTGSTAMLVTASHWYVPIIPGDDGMAEPSEMTPMTKMIDAALR